MPSTFALRIGVVISAAVALLASVSSTEAAGNSITSPDTVGDVGSFTSLALDSTGNLVVSYRDSTNRDLKVLHCNDANCAGGDESITTPDTSGETGAQTSLELDAVGNPVVSYTRIGDLKLLHCNDPNCSGGGESISVPDAFGNIAETSLKLDALGNPVVAYFDSNPNWRLKLLHCNDASCTGGGESITIPDTTGRVGGTPSLALDSAGNPVVSYYDLDNADLKILHCDDANCAGSGDSITSPDTVGSVGSETSLALDASGNPVVSYWDSANSDLKVIHCDDPNCAGAGESLISPDTSGSVGAYTSLALEGSGNPVVSYLDIANSDLKVLSCNDANCAGADDSVTSPDMGDYVGQHTSIALDSSGNPVVSYHDFRNYDLKVLHCGDPMCKPVTQPTPTPEPVGAISHDPTSSSGGGFDLRLLIIGLVSAAAMAAAASGVAWRR